MATVGESSEAKKAADAKADDNAEDSVGKTRQRFFSQAEVNRIVKRETERALKTAAQPELDAARTKVTELESKLAHRELRDQVTEAAARAGAKNASLVFRAIEEKIERDEHGKAANLDEVIKTARRDYPELFRRDTTGNADGGAGQQNQPTLSMNELLRRGRDG